MIKEEFLGRILVVSNECFSEASSNGRTIMNFLRGINPLQLAQFYLHGNPDMTFCCNYYHVSDGDALRAFLHKKPTRSLSNLSEKVAEKKDKKVERNCRNLVLRDLIWSSFKWWNKNFNDFIRSFAPTVVLFQAGDMPFMFKIAVKIAKSQNIPLIIYNSEHYVLKKKMYSGIRSFSFWHKVLQQRLKKQYKKMMHTVSYCIYSTEYLEQCYQEKYPHEGKSIALYTVSEMSQLPKIKKYNEFHLLYCGNLGVGRVQPLSEVAEILKKINSDAILDIYGKFASKEDEEKVCNYSNVHYGGFISYEEIPSVMSEATMLLHCENNDRLENLRGAFSTKIADSLASGRPFIVYASREYPFVQYLEKNKSAHIAADAQELESILSACIIDEEYQNKYTNNAIQLAFQRHSIENNCTKMRKILNAVTQIKSE